MEFEYPWQEHEDGEPYILLRTTKGIFELNREDTVVFMPNDIAMRGLRHVFHITEENEDKYVGLYMWANMFRKAGLDLDVFIDELQEQDYHTEYFDEPAPEDLKAYEEAHGFAFEPETLDEILDHHEPSQLFEKIVEAAMKNFDSGWKYFSEEWGDGRT